MTAFAKLQNRMDQANSLVCVGLDSDIEKLPAQFSLEKEAFPQFAFNKYIIDTTHEFVCAYKPNMAFYEARGEQGIGELKMTMEYLQAERPEIFTICDAKRADIGNTNLGYAKSIFDWYGFDAVTLHPYLGKEALEPFLAREDKTMIILCRTSNPGAGEFQDLRVGEGEHQAPLWQTVAQNVANNWNEHKNCMLVVGATYPEEMQKIRQVVGEMTLLVPGIGAQGGNVEEVMKAGLNTKKKGLIISSSRDIIFANDPAAKAKALRDEINSYR